MSFDEIKGFNINSKPVPKHNKKEQKKPDAEIKEKKQKKENVPNNPAYWQSAIGIKRANPVFKGKPENDEPCSEQYLAQIEEKIHSMASLFWERDFEKTAIETVKKLAKISKKSVDNYYNLISKMERGSTRYTDFAGLLIEKYPNIDEQDIDVFSKFFNLLIYKSNDVVELIKKDFNSILEEKNGIKLHNFVNFMSKAPANDFAFAKFADFSELIINNADKQLNDKQIESFTGFFNWVHSFPDRKYEAIKSNYIYVLNSSKGTAEDRIDWLSTYVVSSIINPEKDNLNERFDSGFDSFISFKKKMPKNFNLEIIKTFQISPDDIKQMLDLMKKGKIKEEHLSGFLMKAEMTDRYYSSKIKKTLSAICSKDEAGKVFNTLIDKNPNFGKNDTLLMSEILEKDLIAAQRIIDFYSGEKDPDINIVRNLLYFNKVLSYLNKNNVEDYLSLIKDKRVYEQYEMAEYGANPITYKFDMDVYNEKNYLQSKLKLSEYTASEIIKESIDTVTCQVSPVAKEVIRFFGEEDSPFKKKILGLASKVSKNARNKLKIKDKFSGSLGALIKSLRDNDNKFSEKNWEYAKKFISHDKETYFGYYYLYELIHQSKDEKGIITPERYNFSSNVLKKIKNYSAAANVIKTMNTYFDKLSFEKQEEIFTFVSNLEFIKKSNFSNFNGLLKFCFNKDTSLNKKNYEFFEKIQSKNDHLYLMNLTDSFFDMLEVEDNRDFLMELIDIEKINFSELAFANEMFKQEDGSFPEEIKQKIKEIVATGLRIEDFCNIYNACKIPDEQGNEKFNQEMYDKTLRMLKMFGKGIPSSTYIDTKIFVQMANMDIDVKSYNFKNKIQILSVLKVLKPLIKDDELSAYFDKIITEIDANLNNMYDAMPVNINDKNAFISNVLKINPKEPDKLTRFEKVITDSIPQLENLSKGLPLKYSREDFLSDLSDICNNNENASKIISQKTGIDIISETVDDEIKITGYNGLISLANLDKNNKTEKIIYDCIHKFMYENSVNTGNYELDEQLNYIIKAFPEFINSIGKKQHGTHKYTLDIHQLLVLAYSMNNPDYLKKLNGRDKVILKMASLFHDISKRENEVDLGHQNIASIYAKNIAKKVMPNPNTIDRVYDIVNNHHWLQQYNLAGDKTKISKELAYRFRRPNDFDIAKIMADSDLKAVSESFYNEHKSALKDTSEVEKNLQKMYATGNALFTDYIIAPSKLESKKEIKDGKQYSVINLHNIKDDEDMHEYGFHHIKKKDLNFLVHMVDSGFIYNSLNTVKMLASPVNGGVLSESLITPNHTRTYCNRKHGVLLSQLNTNIVNETNTNQGSGTEKDFSVLLDLIFSEYRNSSRLNFRNDLLTYLSINKDEVTDDEYAEFYKNVLAAKQSILEIAPDKIFNIGKHKFTGNDLIEAIKKYQNSLLRTDIDQHNEIVGYIPKIQAVISKSKSLQDVPSELLKFADENNLPVILI